MRGRISPDTGRWAARDQLSKYDAWPSGTTLALVIGQHQLAFGRPVLAIRTSCRTNNELPSKSPTQDTSGVGPAGEASGRSGNWLAPPPRAADGRRSCGAACSARGWLWIWASRYR